MWPERLVTEWKICVGTWNIGILMGILREIVDVMKRRKIYILCLQETRWEENGTEEMGNGYNSITIGCHEQEKLLFRQDFESTIRTVKEEQKLIIGADMYGRVEKRNDGYKDVHGGHGFGTRNEDGAYVLEMAQSFELECINTWFQLDKHLITYESGGVESQIDYILVRKADKKSVMNCKVILGETCIKKYSLVLINFIMREHNSKVLEGVLDERLREVVKIEKQQHGFMRGRGTVETIFIVRQLQKKRLGWNQKLFCASVDL
ncbi:uncharacterized protein [Palaemon carinicauda]|uniref:uncharacterized protein n=1 Tax=Palaemon carinicauda TaxID=392227 RepID=UPI0035B5BFC5